MSPTVRTRRSAAKEDETPQREATKSYATPAGKSETESEKAPLVTPADSVEVAKDKQVRFDAAEEETSNTTSPRGLVSRRGGRFGCQRLSSPKEIEYKTYKSPTKDEVPSLCSTNSGQLGNDAPTDSISCDHAAESTSPLAPDASRSQQPKTATTPPPSIKLEDQKMSPRMEEKKEDSKLSPRRNVATPTDFCWDYGKASTGSFDQSNVLAWLTSPNGMFSPGGYGSVQNTPARTPGTPTVSTSFFFTDVAGLPRAGDSSTPKRVSNIICISPLSSKQRPTGKDLFASPRASLPLLSDSTPSRRERLQVPRRSASKDPSLDAVHLAEREVYEDEDLNVLLQLAASNTPRNSTQPVFRSPRRKEANEGSDDLPALQLPMIGREGEKTKKSEEPEDLGRPQLGMRSNGNKEMFGQRKDKDEKPEKSASKKSAYPMHPYAGNDGYYSMAPGVPPGPAGSMRVVMGGPLQPRGKGSPPRGSGHYHEYPRGVPYPPPGMYAQYPPPYGGMGGYPYSYPPGPQRPMHMYGQPPTPKGSKKSVSKRPPAALEKSPTSKKQRKSPGSAKRKNKSPQITDKAERQKAAETIKAMNVASGGKNDKAAALAAAVLRGVTMRPSGKWQAQLYFAGKSRYIGVFDSREKAALAYEIARERLKAGDAEGGTMTPKTTENLVNAARKAAFEGVNEKGK